MTARQRTWSGQILSISDKPIISVKEARKILGKSYKRLSNEDIMGVIVSLTKIGDYLIHQSIVPKVKVV